MGEKHMDRALLSSLRPYFSRKRPFEWFQAGQTAKIELKISPYEHDYNNIRARGGL